MKVALMFNLIILGTSDIGKLIQECYKFVQMD